MALQPSDIASNFTLIQINERITSLMLAVANAEQSAQDSFSDTQAQQNVRRQRLDDLNNSLSIWLKAKSILSETNEAELIAADYNPAWPRG